MLLIGLVFLFPACLCQAQNVLIIDKPNKVKRVKYRVGSEISFSLKDGNTRYRDTIKFLNYQDQSLILSSGQKFHLKSIKMVYGRKGRQPVLFAIEFLYKGAFALLGVSTFNRAINNEKPVVNKDFAIASGISAGAGTALIPFSKKRYKQEKYRFRILNLDPEESK